MKFVGNIILFFYLVLGTQFSFASDYEITFIEGANLFKDNAQDDGLADIDNKYLAKVSIKKDGEIILKNIKGSTLSDSVYLYEMWHVLDGETIVRSPPSDNDIKRIFEKWELDIKSPNQPMISPGLSSLSEFIKNYAEIVKHLTYVPVIKSGTYNFIMGCHKNCTSVHGHPYACRLAGSKYINKPYNGIPSSGIEKTIHGGYIATINKNKSQKMRRVANGVNIHDGRRTDTYKDSTACLTIHPDDWSKFWEILPTPLEWIEEKHKGKVVIERWDRQNLLPYPPQITDLSTGP